jgi:energy-coupling factor transport system permease protein
MHTMAWSGWVLMVMAIALSTTNPFYLAIVLLSVGLVAVLAPKTGQGFASFKALLLLGTGVLVMSVLIAVVNGNMGQHVLFTVPGPEVPHWLGGLQVGGPVTAEALVANGLRGLTILCIFLAFGVFSGAVSPHRVLRTAPAAVFHAGLVVTVGLTLLPSSIDDLRRIREMQALRGAGTGLRQMVGIVVPAVIGGLERSMRLAEAMEARGYASSPPPPRGGQTAGAVAPLLLLGASYFWLTGGMVWALLLGGAGMGSLGLWIWLSARSRRTTR